MNKKILIIGIALAAMVINVEAQSPAPLLPPVTAASLGDTNGQIEATTTNVDKTPSPLSQLEIGVTAGYQALTQLSFTNGFAAGPFGIRHNSDYGGGIFARTVNPSGVNVGFALAGIYEHTKDAVTLKSKSSLNFYDATVNISLGGTTVIPFINFPLDYIIESGPATNLKYPKTVYEQSLVGVEKTWRFGKPVPGSKAFALTVEAGEGHCSKWGNGFFQEVAAALTYKPHGW